MEHLALVTAVAEANKAKYAIECARREREKALNAVTSATLATVFTAESAWPNNQRWSRPEIGDVVVRPLKKDGKPAANCLVIGAWRTGIWLPEGEKPQGGAK
jgi:hypothetical protein